MITAYGWVNLFFMIICLIFLGWLLYHYKKTHGPRK